jgi:hypothetical protein
MASHLPSENASIKFNQLTKEQIAEFHDKGYLILRDILTDSEASKLAIWTKEVKETIPAIGTGPMPYMEIDKRGRRVLTVTEVSTFDKLAYIDDSELTYLLLHPPTHRTSAIPTQVSTPSCALHPSSPPSPN